MERVIAKQWIKIDFEGKQYRFYIDKPHTIHLNDDHYYCSILIEELKIFKFLFLKHNYWSSIGDSTSVKIKYGDYLYETYHVYPERTVSKHYFTINKAKEMFQTAFSQIKSRDEIERKKIERIKSIKVINYIK